jgi:hypothetical protein
MVCAIALFCQDIREEKAGTVSVIGVLTDNITVSKVPVAFPQMAIYARLSFLASDEGPKTIAMRIVYADGKEMALATFDTDLIQKGRHEAQTKGAAKVGLVSSAMIAPFAVNHAGRLNVIASVDGVDEICGTLNVQVAEAKS